MFVYTENLRRVVKKWTLQGLEIRAHHVHFGRTIEYLRDPSTLNKGCNLVCSTLGPKSALIITVSQIGAVVSEICYFKSEFPHFIKRGKTERKDCSFGWKRQSVAQATGMQNKNKAFF